MKISLNKEQQKQKLDVLKNKLLLIFADKELV